jgi:hypothetical protein
MSEGCTLTLHMCAPEAAGAGVHDSGQPATFALPPSEAVFQMHNARRWELWEMLQGEGVRARIPFASGACISRAHAHIPRKNIELKDLSRLFALRAGASRVINK